MKTFVFVVNVLVYVRSAPTDPETVWLKDMTTRFQTDKRTLTDIGLADELTYHLMRGSNALTLNLKRNFGIDPNADIYVVQKLKNGRSLLKKTQNLEKEDVAYYQDIENGAFMTVRCVKRSNGQCDRVLNGNIRIGDRNYDLRSEETDVTSRNVLGVPGLLGKRYVLHDQANNQRKMSAENKDAANVNEKNVEQELINLLRRFPQEQDKKNNFPRADTMLSSRYVTSLHNGGTPVKKDNTVKVYDVEVTVLIDSGVWDLFWSVIKPSNNKPQEQKVQQTIRKFYSHIFNGVHLRFKEIEDPSIEISVTLRHFVFFQGGDYFPHAESKVNIVNGTKCIDVSKYLDDLYEWDITSSWELPEYDHAMLFTIYDLCKNQPSDNGARGLSWTGGVCGLGTRTSVIEASDYFWTVGTATHELAHSLGAVHDGDEGAKECKSEDLFIMTSVPPVFHPGQPYSRNPWLFSNCSVEAFKKTLPERECVHNKGVIYNQAEWTNITKKLPGEKYSIKQQCEFIMGPKSMYCGDVLANICLFMQCTDPVTGQCPKKYFGAARGTSCGLNMWCIEGRCVLKIGTTGPQPQ